MEIKIDGKMVDVSAQSCKGKWCFRLGRDYGPFTPGRGYTSYYKKPKWVCMQRHLHGCPDSCPVCDGETENGWKQICNKCIDKDSRHSDV